MVFISVTTNRATAGTGRVGLPRAITKQSQPPPAPAEIKTAASPLPVVMPPEAKNPTQFRIPNLAYPPPPVTVVEAVAVQSPITVSATAPVPQKPARQPLPLTEKKFSVQDRLRIVPT